MAQFGKPFGKPFAKEFDRKFATKFDRRTFIAGIASAAALSVIGCKTNKTGKNRVGSPAPTTEEAHGLGSEDANSPAMSDGRPALRVLMLEADSSPLDPDRVRFILARDLQNDTLPQAIVTGAGRARIELADEPIQVSCRLKVPDFGEVYCFADNDGRGYSNAQTIDFVTDAARTRVRRVREAQERLRHTGLTLDRAYDDHLAAASRKIPKGATSLAYECLSHGLHAGEMLTLAAAKQRIARLKAPRADFKFGILCSGYDTRGPAYAQYLKDRFNFATASWYAWKAEEPPEGRIDYARMDNSIQWCLDNRINPKGFGYLYMARGATPEWIRPIETPASTQPATQPPASPPVSSPPVSSLGQSFGDSPSPTRQFNPRWPYEQIRDLYPKVIRETMARYNGRIEYAEIMNEAHDKANLWHLEHERVLEMAKLAFDAAREGSPTVKRMMNHCCLWAEYGKKRNDHGERCWSPYQFVKACMDHGVEYETIGLQLYYPTMDLFEIERMLDRFAVFNKPLHITEIATASQDGLDPASMRPKTWAPGWHGPWTQTTQADWLEAIYTLCYSKPQFECIGWWDLADVPGHFWPYGGLLDANLQPKESYHRLAKLQDEWGVSPASRV